LRRRAYDRSGRAGSGPLVIEAITTPEAPYYVCLLVNPVTSRPFYVGKGRGEPFRGHGIEAAVLSAADASGAEQRRKLARIQAIRAAGQEPCIEFARIPIPTDREAFLVEAALIDVLDRHGDRLVNEVRGHDAGSWNRIRFGGCAMVPEPIGELRRF